MSEERSRRLSQIFDPLSRFTDHSGAGQSSSTPNSPRLMPRRSRDPPPPPPRLIYCFIVLYCHFLISNRFFLKKLFDGMIRLYVIVVSVYVFVCLSINFLKTNSYVEVILFDLKEVNSKLKNLSTYFKKLNEWWLLKELTSSFNIESPWKETIM